MSCATCPACGRDLIRLERFRLGDLDVIGNAAVFWRLQRIKLTPAETLLVVALARAAGAIIKGHVLAEIIDSEATSPESLLTSMVCKIRKKFRCIDLSFNEIELASNMHGSGLRWRQSDDVVADLRRATPRQREVHKAMLMNPGLTQAKLMPLLGFNNRNALTRILYSMRRKGLARRESTAWGSWRALGSIAMHDQIQ
jgi:hypothetical protein